MHATCVVVRSMCTCSRQYVIAKCVVVRNIFMHETCARVQGPVFLSILGLRQLPYVAEIAHVSFFTPYLVPLGFSSVVLPIFASTADKFRKLYSLRLVSQHQSSSKWLEPCCVPRSLLSGARTCSTNEYNRGEKQDFL